MIGFQRKGALFFLSLERAVYQNEEGPISDLIFDPFESPYRLGTTIETDAAGDEGSEQLAVDSKTNAVKGRNASDGSAVDFKQEVQDFEVGLIKQALERSQFNQKKAAEQLGLSYHQLRGYLRKYELLG